MPSPIQMKTLLEAGVHFGHQTRRWNPKMKPFIFTERNGIHIIDLQQTVRKLEEAMAWVRELSAGGGTILFVGTKKQAQETIEEEARRCEMPFVNRRWLGGTLTNFQTILSRIRRLEDLQQQREVGMFERLPKKEASRLEDEVGRLERLLGGMRGRYRLPEAVFIVDPHRETIAVAESRRAEIPIVAMVDTNCNPDLIDYPIPANDDAIRAIRLLASKIADAVIEGRQEHESAQADLEPGEADVEADEEEAAEKVAALDVGFVPREWTEPADGAAQAATTEAEVAAAAEIETDQGSAPLETGVVAEQLPPSDRPPARGRAARSAAAEAAPEPANGPATEAAEVVAHISPEEPRGSETPAGVVTGGSEPEDRAPTAGAEEQTA